VPVALDEVAYMFGQFIALHIEPGLNFGSDILRNVLGPMIEGVEPLQVLRGCCEQQFVPAHPRALMCYCVRNLYVTIRATMLAKISSAGRDFRIIGLVEWRAAD
jgi:hypothetical protein